MSGAIAEVHWFPSHGDRFLTWGSEINLYQLKSSHEVDQDVATNINLNISASTTAILLAAEARYQYIRCVAPSFRRNGELVLAVGLANGKVGLCNFVSNTENNVEFTPKQSRPCVCLAWHELDTNLLAIGHDRNRSDHCITIWDTERGLAKEKAITNLIGLSETAHSLCWDRQSRILIGGMSHKYIKVIDFRHSSPLISATTTRAVHGVAMSPNGRLITSYIDNLVTLWDLRNIEKPVAVHAMEKNVSALSWCTTRQSTLAIVQRDAAHIQLLDLHGSGNEMVLTEPFSIKRVVSPFQTRQRASTNTAAGADAGTQSSKSPGAGGATAAGTTPTAPALVYHEGLVRRGITLSGISWHPFSVERMLALSGSGQIVDFTVQQRVAISFDTINNLCGSLGMNMRCLRQSQTQRRAVAAEAAESVQQLAAGLQQVQLSQGAAPTAAAAATAAAPSAEAIEVAGEWTTDIETPDVMDLIYRRAINDYGKLHDLQRNGNLAENAELVPVWQLMANISNKGLGDDSFAGLCDILGISTQRDSAPMYASDTKLLFWAEYPTAPPVKVFRNEARIISQQLCGWTFDALKPADTLQPFCDILCAKEEYTRAAMIACMQQQVGMAIEILQIAAEQQPDANLQMSAMALSGLNFDKDTKWRTQCKAVRGQLKDPHLRALFAFLTPDADPNFDSILQETTISVSDRVAFACQFLCDAKLAEYVQRLIAECHTGGNLCGLLLTGARPAGVALLQSFVDRHDDVQTAALVAVKFLSAELLDDDQVQFWIESYRDLLDVWGLWEHRAHFDIAIGQLQNPPRIARSVYLLCSFCGKSVSACLAEESRQRSGSVNVNKMSSCPNCRKPLPRCSICLLHMGTPTAGGQTGTSPAQAAAATAAAAAAASATSEAGSVSAMPSTSTATATAAAAAAAIPTTTSPSGSTVTPTTTTAQQPATGTATTPASASAAAATTSTATAATGTGTGADLVDGAGWQSKPFSRWFSWCQTCRHGGHTEHLTEWFELHSECPVASCACKCFALDVSVPTYNNVTSIL